MALPRETHHHARMLDALLDVIFAPICLGCDSRISPGDNARLICRVCRTRLVPLPAPRCDRCSTPLPRTGRAVSACAQCRDWPAYLRCARSACVLAPPADRIMHQFKYRGWRALAGPMAERMAALDLPDDTRREARIVVCVATTEARLRVRGYNQAELLARELARRSGRQFRAVLERSTGSSQTVLQPVARGANVAGAFRIATCGVRDLAGEHVILVDDVLTTGATLVECARTLSSAGVRCVSAITFARALDARRLLGT
jgi:ComF family protein